MIQLPKFVHAKKGLLKLYIMYCYFEGIFHIFFFPGVLTNINSLHRVTGRKLSVPFIILVSFYNHGIYFDHIEPASSLPSTSGSTFCPFFIQIGPCRTDNVGEEERGGWDWKKSTSWDSNSGRPKCNGAICCTMPMSFCFLNAFLM